MVTPPGTSDIEPPPVTAEPRERIRFSSFSVIRAVLVIVAAIVVLQLVALADTTLWWLAIATALAGLYEPAAMWLRRFVPGWLAIAIVVFGVVVVIGLLGYRGFDELSRQLASLRTDAERTAQEIEASEQFGDVAKEFGLSQKVSTFFQDLPSEVVGGDAATALQSAASSGGALFAIWTLSLLMLIFGSRIVRSAFAQIDDPVIAFRAQSLVLRAYADSSRYVWLMISRALVVGVVSGLGCAALGVQTPTAFAVWFALLSLIPGFGIVVAAIPLAIFQSVSSAPLGLFIIGLAIIVQAADVVFVQRRIEASSVHVGPGLMIVAALVGFQIYGPGGLLVMLAAVVFGMAFIRRLTEDHDNVVSATRALMEATPADI
jgi:predicted PurR-regulated permease PerM